MSERAYNHPESDPSDAYHGWPGPDPYETPRKASSRQSQTPPPHLGIENAADLRRMTFPPIQYVVPGYIAEGCTLLAGRPKLGKSWLVLESGLAVAIGSDCLGGIACRQGDVLYLALEDNRRRLQRRIDKVLGAFAKEWPAAFEYATEWPRANEGGLDRIREWIKSKANPRLVIVDVLAMFKPVRGSSESLYEADYAAIKGLQGLAGEYGIAIVVVHHTRKSGAESDPFEKVSGTLGLSGAADTALILDRDSNGATLYGRGRDIEEIESAVIFDKESCRWLIQGEATDVRRTDERSTILSVLLEADASMSPIDLSDATGMPNLNIRQLLFKMVKAGEIEKCGRGRYRHPDRADIGNSQYPRNNDNKITNPGVYRRSHDGEGYDD
ncbi:AAA family ATPase [Methylobacterium sp. D54C]